MFSCILEFWSLDWLSLFLNLDLEWMECIPDWFSKHKTINQLQNSWTVTALILNKSKKFKWPLTSSPKYPEITIMLYTT